MKPKTEEELKKLARDILADKVFTDQKLPKDDPDIFRYVFLPLAFMDEKQLNDLEGVAMIYEYYDRAGPRSINGYPTFVSFNSVTKPELEKVVDYYNKYKKAMEQV